MSIHKTTRDVVDDAFCVNSRDNTRQYRVDVAYSIALTQRFMSIHMTVSRWRTRVRARHSCDVLVKNGTRIRNRPAVSFKRFKHVFHDSASLEERSSEYVFAHLIIRACCCMLKHAKCRSLHVLLLNYVLKINIVSLLWNQHGVVVLKLI